jgi:hypothetical protein
VGECGGHACRWDDDVQTDLNDLIPDNLTTCGPLAAAWDINDAGQVAGYWVVDGQPLPRMFVMDLEGEVSCNEDDTLDACDIAQGTSQDCNENGYPDECDLAAGFSEDANGNDVPDECARIEAARSCWTHGAAGEFCLDIGTGDARVPGDNIEPRIPGVTKMAFDTTEPVAADSTVGLVSCTDMNGQDVEYAGIAAVSADGSTTVIVEFSEPLPDQACCAITFKFGMKDSSAVRTLEGDVDFDGSVLTPDASKVKTHFQEPVGPGNFWYDVDCDGQILTPDASKVKSRFQNMAPACP